MNNDPPTYWENRCTIGQNLCTIRRAHVDRPSQADLAKHLGLSANTVQSYESGRNRIKADTIPHIAAFLGCEIVDLFEGVES